MKEDLEKYVKSAKAGNNKAFDKLYEMTRVQSYYTALKITNSTHDADDVLQEAYIKAYTNLNKLNDDSKFQSWIDTIVSRYAINAVKKKKPDVFSSYDSEDFDESFEDTLENKDNTLLPDEVTDNKAVKEIVSESINKLSDEQRTCIVMFYFDELSIKEIAETLNIPEGTVKSRLNKSRKILKDDFENIEKTQGIKLHGIPYVPLLKYVLKAESLIIKPALKASTITAAATTAAAGGTAAAVGTTGATAAGAAAGTSIGTKIAAVAIAATIAAGGTSAAVTAHNKSEAVAKRETTSISAVAETASDSAKPETTKKSKYFSNVSSYDYANNKIGTVYASDDKHRFASTSIIAASDDAIPDYLKKDMNKIYMDDKVLVDGVCTFSMLIYRDKLYYLNLKDMNIYECDINAKKPSTKVINYGAVVNDVGQLPDTPDSEVDMNLYLINGKIVYVAKKEVVEGSRPVAYSYNPANGKTEKLLESDEFGGLEVVPQGIVYNNDLYNENGKKIGKYKVPEKQVIYEDDNSLLIGEYKKADDGDYFDCTKMQWYDKNYGNHEEFDDDSMHTLHMQSPEKTLSYDWGIAYLKSEVNEITESYYYTIEEIPLGDAAD